MHVVGEAWMMIPPAWSIVTDVEIAHALPQPGGVPPHAPHAGAASAVLLLLLASPALAAAPLCVRRRHRPSPCVLPSIWDEALERLGVPGAPSSSLPLCSCLSGVFELAVCAGCGCFLVFQVLCSNKLERVYAGDAHPGRCTFLMRFIGTAYRVLY